MCSHEVFQRRHLHWHTQTFCPVLIPRLHVSPRGSSTGTHTHSWFVLFYSYVFPSPRIPKRFSTGTYADIYFVLFIAMFPISMYPQEIFNGDTNMQTLCPALIPRLYVSPRDSSTGTHTHAILTRHHVRNQVSMTSMQISVTLLTSLIMMCCFTFPVQIVSMICVDRRFPRHGLGA